MLHMEIIQERLEQEFNLDLVTTLPSVIYHVYKSDGTMVKVDNPTTTPTPAPSGTPRSRMSRCPSSVPRTMWATSCPCARSAGASSKDMQYLDTHLVELHYQMPLNEIIYDFFDTLKANTKGLRQSGL